MRIPSGPVADHIRHWLDQGYSRKQIARAAGCAHRTIADIVSGKNPTVHRDIAAKILGAHVGPDLVPDYLPVDSTGTRRRIQAMIAIGHSRVAIARELRLSPEALSVILNEKRPTVRKTTALKVAALYRRWSATPGRSQRARNWATAQGWPGPIAWDRDIDDPAARPYAGRGPRTSTTTRRSAA
jgi:DNA-binding CsgD family transcriptional regulator